MGWTVDKLADLPAKPLKSFDIASLKGRWYKVMGLDSRYDCFDCQKNSFEVKDKSTLKMEALFRIPRPTAPGFLQSKIVEELHAAATESKHPFKMLMLLIIELIWISSIHSNIIVYICIYYLHRHTRQYIIPPIVLVPNKHCIRKYKSL